MIKKKRDLLHQKIQLYHYILTQHLDYLDSGIVGVNVMHKVCKMAQQRLDNFVKRCEVTWDEQMNEGQR